jgi:hypothetical protein
VTFAAEPDWLSGILLVAWLLAPASVLVLVVTLLVV